MLFSYWHISYTYLTFSSAFLNIWNTDLLKCNLRYSVCFNSSHSVLPALWKTHGKISCTRLISCHTLLGGYLLIGFELLFFLISMRFVNSMVMFFINSNVNIYSIFLNNSKKGNPWCPNISHPLFPVPVRAIEVCAPLQWSQIRCCYFVESVFA